MLIDTHCHINMIVKKQFDRLLTSQEINQASDIVQDSFINNVTKIINVGTSNIESINSIELAKRNNSVFAAIGIHPNDLKKNWKNDLKDLASYLKDLNANKIVAIGEVGIDKHYPGFDLNAQQSAFKAQIELALENNLPIIVHTRDAGDETLKIISEYKKDNIKGIIHCFSESLDFANEAIELGFLLGFGGTITYPKNEDLRTVLKAVGLNNIVLETDAPFLAPQIIRGKINTPSQILNIARFISDFLNIEFETICKITTYNAENLFKF